MVRADRAGLRRTVRGASLLGAALLGVAGCGSGGETDTDLPPGWRTFTFDRCCQISLPADFREIPKPDGVIDQTFVSVGSDTAEITFEFRPQVGFPEGPLGQSGWSKSTLMVDGRRADIVAYDARDAFSSGRTLRLRVLLPDEPTFQSAPSPAVGMELGATGHCLDAASCETIEQIYRAIDLPPLRP